MDKILLVSWGVFPMPTGSSIIVNNLATSFTKDQMTIIGEQDISRSNIGWPDDNPEIRYINPNINIKGRGQTHLRWLNIFKVINHIYKVVKDEKITKVLCIFPDDFYLFACYIATKRLNLPLYTWFHNTYLDNYEGYRKLFAFWFQPLIFKFSKKVFVMSDGMLRFYKNKYQDFDFETLVHGFPLPKISNVEYEASKHYPNKVKFLFTGSLNESCRDASVRLIKVILTNPSFEVHVYTGNPKSDFDKFGLNGSNFIYHGFIHLEKLYDKLSSFDVMLLPHGFLGERSDIEFKTIFPTRTIPLLISGKPILAHTPKGVFLTEFLEDNNCGFIVDEPNESSIMSKINQIIENPDEVKLKVKNAFITSKKFDIEMVCSQLKIAMNFKN
jgi:glycosyltransferase involved in cell wall biosynthesis